MIPTIDVIDALRGEGWAPTFADEVRARKHIGVQKHVVRLQHPNLVMNGEAIEVVLTNSHNAKAAYRMYLGIFRMVCLNGMIAGDTFDSIQIRHSNRQIDDVIDASYQIIDAAPQITDSINQMKGISLSNQEKEIFADAAMHLVYDEPEKAPIKSSQLLTPRRSEDHGKSVWQTYNTIQEHIIKGGDRGFNKETRKRVVTRPVKSIDRNTKLNMALDTLARKMAELKTV